VALNTDDEETHMDDPGQGVRTYLDEVTPEKRRGDAERLLELMARVTGEAPHMWGKIIGFGQYHYKYESGREGDAPATAFAPRRAATVIYLADGIGRYADNSRSWGRTPPVSDAYTSKISTRSTHRFSKRSSPSRIGP
jgi:hypothetical protein